MNTTLGLAILLLATIGAIRVLRVAWLASKVAIASLGRCLQAIGSKLATVKPGVFWYQEKQP